MGNGQSAELTDSKVKEILTGKDYLKDGILDDDGFKTENGDIVFEYKDIYMTSTTVTFDPVTFELGAPVAETIEKYGWKVTGYTKTTDEFTTGVWRLFYQDSNYTYLITDESVGNYKPSDYYKTVTKEDGTLKYQTGVDVSVVGQKLSKMLLDKGNIFIKENASASIRTTAWLTDTESEIWKQYKNGDAIFAIGTPTIELYKASFDATASINNATPFTLSSDTYGYIEETKEEQLKEEYNYGIYNNKRNWWIASPSSLDNSGGKFVYGVWGYFSNFSVVNGSRAVRPIVCIPTSVFDSKYSSTLVDE